MKDNILFCNVADYIYSQVVNNYHKKIPFDPPEKYPELSFVSQIDGENRIYPMVRELLQKLDLDKENFGTKDWNPFKEIIKPGDKVLIKPNLVSHYHPAGKKAVLSTIVHGSVIRPIIDYVYKALQGEGSIIIADNPIESADWEPLMSSSGIQGMIDVLCNRGYRVCKVIDLRPQLSKEGKNGKFYYSYQLGDPLGYVMVDLGKDSLFSELDRNSNIHYYTLADSAVDHIDPRYNKESTTDKYHNSSMHKYLVSKSFLDADVILNIAKLKTHCKAGVTLTLKNMLGMIYLKSCMPHHRPGLPPEGDSFPDYPPSYFIESRKIYKVLKEKIYLHKFPGVKLIAGLLHRNKPIEHGNWKGNDTIWRTILDINRIAVYADRNGVMRNTPQRRFFYLIDGIIGQEGNAPIGGTPKTCGVLIGGFNPIMVDALACKIMGIDYRIIKTITAGTKIKKWPLLNKESEFLFPNNNLPNLDFKLPRGWK
ncbi:MAG: DUF362 domain-containing protein [candidate division WOR-3 bacterium]